MLPVRQSVNWLSVALLLTFAGCQQQTGDAPASSSASKPINDSAALTEVTLQVTGMT